MMPLDVAIAAVVVAVWPAGAHAQTIPMGRPDLSGRWTLDVHLSDNPEQVARAIRINTGQVVDSGVGGRGTERGRPAGIDQRRDRGGPGGEGRATGATAQVAPEDLKKIAELTDAVQFAPPSLTIAQTASTFTLTGTRGGTQTLSTNGKAEQQTLDAGVVERRASWEGPTLVVAYDVGRAGILTYTYLLVPTTKQLLIRVNFERERGQPGPFEIRLVYNRVQS